MMRPAKFSEILSRQQQRHATSDVSPPLTTGPCDPRKFYMNKQKNPCTMRRLFLADLDDAAAAAAAEMVRF
jgi:hypothetical protein